MMYIRTHSRAFVSPVQGFGRAVQSRHRSRGMGSAATDAATVGQIGSLSAPAASAVVSSILAGGTGTILGVSLTVAVPIIGAAIAGVTLLVTDLIKNSGCGQTCIETSSWANQAEPLLRQNIAAYFSIAAPRSQSQQNAALANFDATWAALVNLCGNPSTGNAGKRCISDRQSGACTWKATADSPWPGGPAQGVCWNWFNAYRDPIANDPNVVADSASSVVSGAVSELSSLPTWALAAAALVLVAVLS
jgi:hypothetical protein